MATQVHTWRGVLVTLTLSALPAARAEDCLDSMNVCSNASGKNGLTILECLTAYRQCLDRQLVKKPGQSNDKPPDSSPTNEESKKPVPFTPFVDATARAGRPVTRDAADPDSTNKVSLQCLTLRSSETNVMAPEGLHYWSNSARPTNAPGCPVSLTLWYRDPAEAKEQWWEVGPNIGGTFLTTGGPAETIRAQR